VVSAGRGAVEALQPYGIVEEVPWKQPTARERMMGIDHRRGWRLVHNHWDRLAELRDTIAPAADARAS
jgi:hypothetical protein